MSHLQIIKNKKLHVFIADDDTDDIDFMMTALKDISDDIEISVATTSHELVEFIQVTIPDIIFLDINMPCKNGVECLAEIRAVEKLNNTPVIICSTTSSPLQLDKTYQLGASVYLEKPSNYNAIKEVLQKILSFTDSELLPQLPRDKFLITT